MSIKNDWARREVEIACKKEDPEGKVWDYGIACYKSALKAYESLLEDEHSGMSWAFTRNILIRLMKNLPLTSITDEDFFIEKDEFEFDDEYLKKNGFKSEKQCPRMSSLFRYEKLDGTIIYSDVERYYCYNKNCPSETWGGGFYSEILNEYYPITMPYYPYNEKFKMECSEILFDKRGGGDFDTLAVWKIITPLDEIKEVNRFWKETETGWKEITAEEWELRSSTEPVAVENNT